MGVLKTYAVVLLTVGALANDLQVLDADITKTLPAEQYFIDKIFDKYGDKGIITFEVSKFRSEIDILKFNCFHR